MPRLTQEELNQVQYVSVEDFSRRIDQIESLEDKLAFTTRYILSYGQDRGVRPDYPIDHIIKIAHMKIADKSSDIKELYQTTAVNEGRADQMVDPTVSSYEKDIANQMFIANPVTYLKGQAKAIEDKIRTKSWKSNEDIATLANYGRLRNEVFTDQFAARIAEAVRHPTAFDVKARLETAFGGPKGFQKAYEKTKPGFLSGLFGTRSVAARNLDDAFRAFDNPNHALHGDMPTVQIAAKQYLQHVLPDYDPENSNRIPTLEDIANLKGTQHARARLSIELLNATKKQRNMEIGYDELVGACQAKNIQFNDIPQMNRENAIVDPEAQNFQNEIQNDAREEELNAEPAARNNENDNEIQAAENDSYQME